MRSTLCQSSTFASCLSKPRRWRSRFDVELESQSNQSGKLHFMRELVSRFAPILFILFNS